jgi:SAM-dependent methyltransferase
MSGHDVSGGSPERFGFEWQRYPEMISIYEEQFRRWTAPLAPSEWTGRYLLDAGCGMGRNSYWPLTYGAKGAVAIDVDDRSLSAARHNLVKFNDAVVRKLSIYEIDYENEFDICVSIGVIHHLTDPRLALRKLFQAAKPGGRVLIWVYGLENNEWIVKFVDPIRWSLLSRAPIDLVHHLALYPTLALWLYARLSADHSPYLCLLSSFSVRHLRSIVFDQLLPKIANYWPRAVVEDLMREAGLVNIELRWTNEVSWTAIGTKPS